MKVNVLPSPAGKVTELARSDEEKNKQRIIRYKEKKQNLEISSSVRGSAACTIPRWGRQGGRPVYG